MKSSRDTERIQRAEGGTRVWRVVFGVPPKTGELRDGVTDTAAYADARGCARTQAPFHDSRLSPPPLPQFSGTPSWTCGARVPPGQFSRIFAAASRSRVLSASQSMPIVLCVLLFVGCKGEETSPADQSLTARALFEQTTKEFYAPSAEARGAERERLLNEAATRYGELLKRFPRDTNLCAQALYALGNIHASQGKTNEAVKAYAAVGEKYGSQEWEVLQAWKSAADLLWEAKRRDEAKAFYGRIVERFGKNDAPQIIQQVVRGSKTRMME